MTIRDPEVLELLAGEPELLAIADAVSATQAKAAKAATRRPRRIVMRVAVAATVAVAAIVAILAAPQSQPGILGRALAAIGNGPIMHVVTEVSYGSVVVDLTTGQRHVQVFREESWADRQLHRFHFVMSLDGHVVGDLLLPQDAKKGQSGLTVSPGFTALWTGYRAALTDGTATVAGRGTVYGHSVYWLRFKGTSNEHPQAEVGVDAHTYKPLVFRTYANGFHNDERILVAKAVPYKPSEFVRRGPSLFGGTTTGSFSGGSTGSPGGPARTAVYAPWLTAGPIVAGLKLRSVDPYTEEFTSASGGIHPCPPPQPGSARSRCSTKGTHTIKGVELTYGTDSAHRTTVDELPRPDSRTPPSWAKLPAGWVQIQVGTESTGNNSAHRLWTGTLKRDGIYITIETRTSERALLEIARALHTAPKKR